MTIEIIKGDLFSSGCKNLGHGVNVKGAMGAGIAVIFKKKFPNMFSEYKELCRSEMLQPGSCSLHFCDEYKIFNLAIKNHWKDYAAYKHLFSSLMKMKDIAEEKEIKEIALPLIGGGLGGLEKEKIISIKKDVFETSGISLKVYVL